MKTILVLTFAVITFLSVPASAQKEMLTKEETVNYLNKKLQEADGRDLLRSDSPPYRYSDISFKISGDNVVVKYNGTLQGRSVCISTFVFNPGHISRIAVSQHEYDKTTESPVKVIHIQFPSKTGRHSSCLTGALQSDFIDVDHAAFPYFAAAQDNFSRIEKALLHLRDLAKAEDDPFGN